MKVVYVIHSLTIGGAEMIAANYAVALKQRGYKVSVVELFHSDSYLYRKLLEEGVSVVCLFPSVHTLIGRMIRKAYSIIALNTKLNNVLDRFSPDVIHFHTFYASIKISGMPKYKIIFTLHSDLFRFRQYLGKRGVSKFLEFMREGMTVITLSKRMQEDVKHLYGKATVAQIPNGLDFTSIMSKRYEKKDICDELSIPQDAYLLGHVGRFYKVKNHEKIFDIFSKLLQKCKNSYLLLIGGGNGTETQYIKELMNKYQIEDHVKLLGIRNDATALMSCFDAFVLPSHAESFSLVLVEAQIHGVRCVVSDAVPEEVICNNNCFKLSINDDSEKWADYLLRDFVEPKDFKLDAFDMNCVIDRHVELYNSVKDKL